MIAKINAHRMRAMVGAGLLVTMAPAWAETATQTGQADQMNWATYRSPEYGFTMDYSGSMTFYPGSPPPPEHSMIPVCDETAVACFEYNGHALDHTVVVALGVSINVLLDNETEEECEQLDDGPGKMVVLHGRAFYFYETGDAVTGSSENVDDYQTFYDHACFQVALHTVYADVGPLQYPEYGIKPLNASALHEVRSVMDRMARSIVFVGPVKKERAPAGKN
jgi:hypothetical protein